MLTSRPLDFESWMEFFTPRNEIDIQVKVPSEWSYFIARQLLSVDKFNWIRKFLQSQMWQIIIEGTANDDLMTMFIPSACPTKDSLISSDISTKLLGSDSKASC